MSDDGLSSGLEVGFLVETGNSYDELIRLQAVMDSVEGQIVRDAANIERATGGMVKLAGATSQFTAFGSSMTRAERDAVRSLAQIERSGESLSRQLDRDIAAFGMTRDEIRAMKVETAALAAETQGLTDLAEQLRAKQAALTAQKEAAAAATAREAQEVREAAQAYMMFESAAQQGLQAMKEQEALAASANRLRAAIDPNIAAQQRFNQEMAEARMLISAGAISLDEYAAKLRMERTALDNVSGALKAGATSAGAHRQAMMGASYQLQDFMTQVSMGANPINAFAVQGAQLAGQFANVGGKAGAVASFFMGPWGMAITGAILVTGMLTKGLFDGAAAAEEKAKAAKALIVEMDNLYDANMRAIKSERQLQVETLATTHTLWQKAEQTRVATLESLKSARAELLKSQSLSRDIGGHAGMAAAADAKAYAQQIGALDKELVQHAAEVKRMGEAYNAAKIPVMQAAVNETMDAGAASLGRYSRSVGELNLRFSQGKISAKEYGAQYARLTSTREAEQASIDAANKKDRTGASSAERRAASIQREVNLIQEQVSGQLALARAYGISDAAALQALATMKAHEKAIRKQADIEKFVADEMRRTVAERIAGTAKNTADLNYQSTIQQQVNAAVRAGTLGVEQMGDAYNDLIGQREILAALDAAKITGDPQLITEATKALADYKKAQTEATKARQAAQDIQQSDALRREIADIRAATAVSEEYGRARQNIMLFGNGGFEQEMALARVNAESEKALILTRANTDAEVARRSGLFATAEAILKKADAERQAIDSSLGLQTAEEALRGLREAADGLDFAGMFGRGGAAVRDMVDAMRQLNDAQAQHRVLVEAAKGDQAQIARADALFRSAQFAGQMKAIAGTKSLFKEQSGAYKAIHAIEKAMAVWEMANSIRSMAMGKAETASVVGDAMTQASANQAAGASKIFSQLGMWAFPVVGAMVAVLASMGMKGGKGGSAAAPTLPEDIQAQIGVGTIYGSQDAKSESIARSLDIIAANSNSDLEFANQSLRELRSINSGISALAGQLGQQIGLGAAGMFDTSRLNIGSTGKGGFLGIGGSSTTRDLYDQGLQIYNQSVAQILAGNFNAQVYNVVQQVKKKSGFLGIGGGTKTSYYTNFNAIDADIKAGFAEVLRGVADGVVGITGLYSEQMAEDLRRQIQLMQLPGVKFSTKGMSLEDIETALQNYFSSVADQIAGLAAHQMPVLTELRRAGEGMFETLTRVVKTFSSVNIGLSSIGMTGFAHGDAGLGGAARLTDLFGDLDAYQEAIGKFSDKFLTEAERMAPIINAVRGEMDRLGHSGVTTNDQFKALVLGLDLSSDAGRTLFADLMAVAPAFAKITDYMGDLNGTLAESADITKKRRNLEIQIMELQGRSAEALAAKRALELHALEDVLRPMQLYIYALQDEAAAKAVLKTAWERESKDITSLRDKFADLGNNLRDYQATLGNDGSIGNAYQRAASEFAVVADAARLGNADAMGKLSQVSQTFLGQSMDNARSQLDYLRDMARVKQAVSDAIGASDEAVDYQQAQLDALKALVGNHLDLNDNVISVRDAILALQATQQGIVAIGAEVGPMPVIQTMPAAGSDAEVMALRAEIADLRAAVTRVAEAAERGANAGEKTNIHYLGRIVDNDAVRVRSAD